MPIESGKVTIYDVANNAGVAISTVSRVLNDSPDVSRATRARVKRAIEDLKYRPYRTAKALAQRRHQMLAVAIPTFTSPFHNELLKGIRGCLQGSDIDILLSDLGSKRRGRTLLSFLQRGAVDGLLLAGVQVDEGLAGELQSIHAPVVLIGCHWPTFDGYIWDETAGSHAAVHHLISLGHTCIGMIRAHRDSRTQMLRIDGYRQALSEAGIEYEPTLIVSGDTEKHAGFSEEDGYEGMQKLIRTRKYLTAVFASSDVQAIGAWKAITDSGRRVPEDIALVGYDDIKTSRYIGLSSVDQRMQDIGRAATELLLSRLSGENTDEPVAILITPTLMVRRSSAPEHQKTPN